MQRALSASLCMLSEECRPGVLNISVLCGIDDAWMAQCQLLHSSTSQSGITIAEIAKASNLVLMGMFCSV